MSNHTYITGKTKIIAFISDYFALAPPSGQTWNFGLENNRAEDGHLATKFCRLIKPPKGLGEFNLYRLYRMLLGNIQNCAI
jgi:hypothetical protein